MFPFAGSSLFWGATFGEQVEAAAFLPGYYEKGTLVNVVKHAEFSCNLISTTCDKHMCRIEQFDWY